MSLSVEFYCRLCRMSFRGIVSSVVPHGRSFFFVRTFYGVGTHILHASIQVHAVAWTHVPTYCMKIACVSLLIHWIVLDRSCTCLSLDGLGYGDTFQIRACVAILA